MALNYFSSNIADLSRGIDTSSVPNQIKEGYSQELVNVVTNSEGHLEKRKGYQGYYGYVPLRVKTVDYEDSPDIITFTLDGSIDLSGKTPGPIVVYGRLGDDGTMQGDFTASADTHNYYETYTIDQPTGLAPGTDSISRTSVESGITQDAVIVGLAENTVPGQTDNSVIYPDEVSVNATTYQLDIDYTNASASTINAYYYYAEKPVTTGEVYHKPFTSSTNISVPQSEHQLDTVNILVKVEEDDSGTWRLVIPDDVTITSGGDVTITLSTATTGRAIIWAVGSDREATDQVIDGDTITMDIENPDTAFIYTKCYIEDSGTGDLEEVIPDSIVYNSTDDKFTITFTNTTGSSVIFKLIYEFLTIKANAVRVSGTVTAAGSDEAPQLTLWGISHDDIYPSTATAGGHVTHIDGYKRSGEARLICGLGGNLFRALTADEIGSPTPELYPSMRGRATELLLAPVFQVSGAGIARSRGTIEADDVEDNAALITAAAYQSGTGYVDYTLTVTNKAILDSSGSPTTLASVIASTATDPGLEDELTVSGMNHSRLNGTFVIKSVTDVDANTVTISVANNDVVSADYDESNAGGRALIQTDRLVTTGSTDFTAGDRIVSSGAANSDSLVVQRASGTSLVVSGVIASTAFPGGLRIYATRTSNTFTLRDGLNNLNVEYLVPGDMVTIAGFNRTPRIIGIDTTNKTVTFDEELTLSDTSALQFAIQPMGRWYVIEMPDDDFEITPQTRITHLDSNGYTEQPTLRSTIINDNMYFTNGDDEVYKFDGTNLYRSGLPRWQPALFANLDTSTASFVPVKSTVSSVSGNVFTLGSSLESLYSVGDTVYHTQDGALYIVTEVDVTAGTIAVDSTISGAGSGTLNLVQSYRYYFRLNMVDANNNIVTSAMAQSEDFTVQVTVDSQIQLKLVGMPAIDAYDYDRIEVQVYRTFGNSVTPFYLIGTVPVQFDQDDGYITFQDGIPDVALTEGDLDILSGVTGIGSSVKSALRQPLRAKYVTSAANRLVLSNLSGYPELDFVIEKLNDDAELTVSDLTQTNETRWLFRKDNTDTLTTTNMVDRVAYEFVDDSNEEPIIPGDITSTASTFTIASTGHSVSVGDWVYLYHSTPAADNDLTFAGWYQVASTKTNDFTLNDSSHGRAATGGTDNDIDRYIQATIGTDVPILLGEDGNLNIKDANPTGRPYSSPAMLRFSAAVNASMRQVDIGITSQKLFEPWMTATSGGEWGTGRMIIKQPRVFNTTMEVVLDSAHGTSYQVFIDNIRRTGSASPETSVGASTRSFPSRMIVSYKNYPELYDAPELDGDSVIDINSADGQELTGAIPFFAEAAFGAGQKEATVIAFKTNSIYIVDIESRTVQKIDSQGLGCQFPYSIAPTRNGIMFANRSGIWRLNYNLTISWAGHMLEGTWLEGVNRDATLVPTAHHYAVQRRYHLSYPASNATTNDGVFVYDHVRESDQRYGAWSTFTNFPATGWANLQNDAFFGSTEGEVFVLRRAIDNTDYRDDGEAVAEMSVVTRPYTFGSPGIRHKIRAIMSNFKVAGSMLGTTLETAVDLSTNWVATDTFSVTDQSSTEDYRSRQVVTLRSSAKNQKFIYLQLRYKNSTKDEPVILSGIAFTAAPLRQLGIEQPGSTGSVVK
jgi:hypothetical protein